MTTINLAEYVSDYLTAMREAGVNLNSITDPAAHLEDPNSYRGSDGVLGNDFDGPVAKGW